MSGLLRWVLVLMASGVLGVLVGGRAGGMPPALAQAVEEWVWRTLELALQLSLLWVQSRSRAGWSEPARGSAGRSGPSAPAERDPEGDQGEH